MGFRCTESISVPVCWPSDRNVRQRSSINDDLFIASASWYHFCARAPCREIPYRTDTSDIDLPGKQPLHSTTEYTYYTYTHTHTHTALHFPLTPGSSPSGDGHFRVTPTVRCPRPPEFAPSAILCIAVPCLSSSIGPCIYVHTPYMLVPVQFFVCMHTSHKDPGKLT